MEHGSQSFAENGIVSTIKSYVEEKRGVANRSTSSQEGAVDENLDLQDRRGVHKEGEAAGARVRYLIGFDVARIQSNYKSVSHLYRPRQRKGFMWERKRMLIFGKEEGTRELRTLIGNKVNPL